MLSAQQAIQQSLWEESEPKRPALPAPIMSAESQEEYERRRVVEMAEKVHWRAMSRTESLRCWPGVEIQEGEQAWRAFRARDRRVLESNVMLDHKMTEIKRKLLHEYDVVPAFQGGRWVLFTVEGTIDDYI